MAMPNGTQAAHAAVENIDAICESAKARIFAKVLEHYKKNPDSAWSGQYLVDLEKSIKTMYAQWGVEVGNQFKDSLPATMRDFYDKAAAELKKAGKRNAILGAPDPKRINYFLNNSYEQIAMRTAKMSFEHVKALRTIAADVLRESTLTGASRAEVSRQMLDRATTIPGFEFRSRDGRSWTNKSYFKMLARTEIMNAGRAAYDDKCAEEGFDVCLLDFSGGACEKCARYEGRLFSLTGKTPGLPSKADLEAAGVFHPNCTHSYSVIPDYIRETEYNPDGTPKDGSEAPSSEVPAPEEPPPVEEEKEPEAPPYKAFPDDLGNLKVLPSRLGGSTGAQLVEDEFGNKFVMKTGGNAGGDAADHLRNECAADSFYREMGVNVPDFRLYDTPKGPVKLAKYVENGKSLGNWWESASKEEREEMLKKLEPGFKADVLSGNWDVVGMAKDNILIDDNGNPWRIDNGGALKYRAQGAEKSAENWSGGMIDDLWSMRESPNNRDFFGHLQDRKLISDIAGADWSKALEKLPPDDRKVMETRLREVRLLDERYKALEAGGVSPEKADAVVKRSYDRTKEFVTSGYTREHTDGVNKSIVDLVAQGFDDRLPGAVKMNDYGYLRTEHKTPQDSLADKQNSSIQSTILSAAKNINYHNKPGGDMKPNMDKLQAAINLKPELLAEATQGNAAAAYYLRQIEAMEKAVKEGAMTSGTIDVSQPVYFDTPDKKPVHRSATEEIHNYMAKNGGNPQFITEWQADQGGDSYHPGAAKFKVVQLQSQGIDNLDDAEKSGYYIGLPGSVHRKALARAFDEYGKNPNQLAQDMLSHRQYHGAIQQLLETTDFPGNDRERRTVLLARTENKDVVTTAKAGTVSNHNRGANESHSVFTTVKVTGDRITMVEVPYDRITGMYMLERTPGRGGGCFHSLNGAENEITADTHRLPALYVGAYKTKEDLEKYREIYLAWRKKNLK